MKYKIPSKTTRYLLLAQSIRRIRKTAGLNQMEMAKILKVDQTQLSRIENGKRPLEPFEIELLGKFTGLKFDAIYTGQINYWELAKKFNREPPFPVQYRQNAHTRLREILPLVAFSNKIKGAEYTHKLLGSMQIDSAMFTAPDQLIGVQCQIDLITSLLRKEVVSPQNFARLIDFTRNEHVHGFLHEVYIKQESVFGLLKSLLLNVHHYETNFEYSMNQIDGKLLQIKIKPREHMKELSYKEGVLGDFMCKYKKAYFSEFPKYIGAKPVTIDERSCHFHGDLECTYEIKIA